MRISRSSKVVIATIGMACLLTSCGITGGSTGDDEAAMSCMQDIAGDLNTAEIVEVGLIERNVGENAGAAADLADVRKRAILAAAAAAADSYWQPLADAWALNEALLQATLDGGSVPDSPQAYTTFTDNVNLQYAAVSKDTYCRIAFSKKAIPINYESDDK